MCDLFIRGRLTVAMALALLAVGCSNLLGSEAGLPVPVDPGTVLVSVQDQAGRGIEGVDVQIHDIPNTVGSTFSMGQRTNGRGLVEFTFIPAARCRVEVKLPPGYRAGADDLIKPVEVVKSATVQVAFVLVR
jgi:hypothetical protein